MGASFQLLGEGLPPDIVVAGYEAREGLLVPYAVEVTFSTRDASFVVEDLLQQRLALEVRDDDGKIRLFDGLPDRAAFVKATPPQLTFRLRLRPALAVLEHRRGCRIFQDETPVDVIKTMLGDAGVDGDVEWRLLETYAPREFLCQYRETELNFLHRLCEEEGIFYFFEHGPDGHKLVFGDHPGAFAPHSGVEKPVLAARAGTSSGSRTLTELQRTKTLRPTSVLLRDYDFEKPDLPPSANVPAPGVLNIQHFGYPGGFTDQGEGSRRAKATLAALRGDVDTCTGRSHAVDLMVGAPTTIEGAHESFLNGDYVITELASAGRPASEGGGEIDNRFTAIPVDVAFSLPRRARKVKICGVQTAVVTAPSNEQQTIHTDEYGRVKVRFFWDRAGVQDDKSSCWLRVTQTQLGRSMVLPRVGWELAVAFLDGDPDRPVAIGRVYNAEEVPPYGLPGAAADGSLKSMVSPGGAGANELKTGDSAGGQGLSVSAQKDLNVSCGNDKNETIAANEKTDITANYKVTIGADETVTVGGNQDIHCGNALQGKIGGAQSVAVGGNDQTHCAANQLEKVGGGRNYDVGGNVITISCGVRTNVTGAFSRSVGSLQACIAAGSICDTMMSTYTETIGAAAVQVVAGTAVETVTGAKTQTCLAGEVHVVSGMSTEAASVKNLVGGVSMRNCGGDFSVSASTIVLAGGSGTFKGGGSTVKMGGSVNLQGATIAIDAAAIVKRGGNLKIG